MNNALSVPDGMETPPLDDPVNSFFTVVETKGIEPEFVVLERVRR